MAVQAMTKAGAAAVLLALLAGAPAALAHGAGEAREIDTRVLLDDDGAVAYGACAEGQCAVGADGLDLLALDVREAWLGDAPALVLRVTYQTDGDPAGRGIDIDLMAGKSPITLSLASADGVTFTGSGFDRVDGPVDVLDGHPKALDGWVRLATLAVAQGDQLTGITVTSQAGGEPDDVMPGGWYANGVEVPHVPHGSDPGEALAPAGPGTYAVKGPAPLVTLSAAPALLDLDRSANLTVKVTNPLASLPQAVVVQAPGLRGAFPGGADEAVLSLDPGATRTLTLAWPLDAPSGNATVLATSDLGGRALQAVQVVAVPAPASHDGHGEPEAGADGKDTPMPWVAPAALALALVARRRR